MGRAALATKADLGAPGLEIQALRSAMRWMFGFLASLILAIAAKSFGVI